MYMYGGSMGVWYDGVISKGQHTALWGPVATAHRNLGELCSCCPAYAAAVFSETVISKYKT